MRIEFNLAHKKNHIAVTLYLPQEMVAQIDQVAKKRFMHRSTLVTQIILQWFESPEVFPRSADESRTRKRPRKKRPVNGIGPVTE